MTNGRGPASSAGMASFMTKKKKYKFQVEICLEELLEVPFVSAVLFAKLRLLDGGNFQDYSSRQEVRDHKVLWNSSFAFPCKMLANASTGVMERCVLRVSIRKESKGGRSFAKLGFVDLNLAEYAGAGLVRRKALLEGYDARRRQDNSMLRFKIELSMVSGDIVFKAPSPTLTHKQLNAEEPCNEQRSDEFSSGSLAGSIASGSSGFGSLPKKRPPLLSSDLVIGQTLSEGNAPVTIAWEDSNPQQQQQQHPQNVIHHQSSASGPPPEIVHETAATDPGGGHSRNSSNTSQLSKASGYSSSVQSHSHSRQSSSGDSGHIRDLHSRSVRTRNVPNANSMFRTNTYPKKITIPKTIPASGREVFSTPEVGMLTSTPVKNADDLSDPEDESRYGTPRAFQTQASFVSDSSNEEYRTPDGKTTNDRSDAFANDFNRLQHSSSTSVFERIKGAIPAREADDDRKKGEGVLRSKSEFQIPKMPVAAAQPERSLATKIFSTESLFSFLTPRPKRKNADERRFGSRASPADKPGNLDFKQPNSLPQTRTTSLCSLRSGGDGLCVDRNASAGSLVLSETGSLDRAKAAYERRKKSQAPEGDSATAQGRVEITRVNPDHLIEELLKSTNLEQHDDSAETSGLQLFIAKDGTAALGNHEVKSQMSTGAQVFKQVVMDDR